MSTSNFDSLGSPSQKRSRPEQESPFDAAGPEDASGHQDVDRTSPESAFRPKKLRPFTALNDSQDECAVGGVGGVNSGRHLSSICSLPQYVTAVTHPNESELLNNGDSGFQELSIPDENSLDINEIVDVTNNQNVDVGTGGDGSTDSAVEPLNGDEKCDYEVDDDDNISELSCASDMSNLSGEDWKPVSSHIKWIQMQMEQGTSPKDIVRQLTGEDLTDDLDNMSALRLIVRLISESNVRSKLSHINTIEDVISLIEKSSKIIVLTGAGVSVSCGIPDFRSRNGIYARLSKDYPDLPDPQSMFDIHYFKRNPYPFFKFAKEIYPGQFSPSPSHKFIRCIERKGKLLRNYSQNIDTLEQAAGIERVIACHGSFATATCTNCGYKVDSNAIRPDIFAQHIPLCQKCNTVSSTDCSIMPVMKPDIVFFGEGLSDEFHNSMTTDKDECDLLIVIGSSLKVRPVALIPNSIPDTVPQILINREPLSHLNFDVELLGDCDIILKHLCKRLGPDWSEFCFSNPEKTTVDAENGEQTNDDEFEFSAPCRYIFKGAELNYAGLDDSDDENVDEEDSASEINDENNENNTTDSRDFSTEESLTTLSTSNESSGDNFDKMNKSSDNDSFNNQANNLPTKSLPLVDRENGQTKPMAIYSPTDSIQCTKNTTPESIENYSPNSF